MTWSYSFSLCVFYENDKQYCLLTKYLTQSTRIDGRLIPSSIRTLCSIGAADIAATKKEAKYSCLPPSNTFQTASGSQSASLVMRPTPRNAEIFQGSELHLSNH